VNRERPDEPCEIYDVTMIGAGPAALFGAFYAGLRGMSVELIDSLSQPGGQLTALYPEKFIYDVPGFPAVLAKTLVGELIRQVGQYRPTLSMNERVEMLRPTDEDTFELVTDKRRHLARSVVICAGAGSFTPKKLPNVNCDEYEGKGLCYFVRNMSMYRGKRVVIIGGGDSAVDWALNLQRVTDDITLVHRLGTFRAHEDSVKKLFDSPVKIKRFCELKRVHGDGFVERATIQNNKTGQTEELAADVILINIGFATSLGPIHDWGLVLDGNGIVVNSKMETNIPGVYAAGDVASYPGKLKLIATGFGEAATAVNHAKTFIDPKSKSFPGHSSSLVPKQRQSAT